MCEESVVGQYKREREKEAETTGSGSITQIIVTWMLRFVVVGGKKAIISLTGHNQSLGKWWW